MTGIAGYAKAVVAFLVGGLTVAYTALVDGAVSPQEWIGIILGALGTPAAVFAVPNKTADRGQALDESMSHDAGQLSLTTILVAVVLVLLVVYLAQRI